MGVIFLWGSISMPSYIWKRRKGKCGFASHVKKRREPHHQSIITLFCHSTKAPAHLTLPASEHSVWYIAFLILYMYIFFFLEFSKLRINADESPQMSTVIQKIWMIPVCMILCLGTLKLMVNIWLHIWLIENYIYVEVGPKPNVKICYIICST